MTALADSFTAGFRALASKSDGRVSLVRRPVSAAGLTRLVEEKAPFLVFISTGDTHLDEELAEAARASGRRNPIVCVVDDPRLNDFNMPAIAEVGDIRVGVSTGGLSPAMAGILRRRIEKVVTPEDVMQVKLQGHIRDISKVILSGPAARKDFAYSVINDTKVSALLKRGLYDEAESLVDEMLRSAGREARARGNEGR